MSDFLDPSGEIQKHGSKLPHWQQESVLQFVTFRLGDSLPASKLNAWRENRKIFLDQNPKPWTEEKEFEYRRLFTQRFEEYLDEGAGSCIFLDTENRHLMESILMKFHGEKYIHESWVIMPNHLHLLFKPLTPLEKIIQSWKSVFSHKYAKGSIWQDRYRDTLIRDSKHYANCVRYIRRNPRNLPQHAFTLWESDRAKMISLNKE